MIRFLVHAIASAARLAVDSLKLKLEELVLPELPYQEETLCEAGTDDAISVVVRRPYKPLRLPSSYG